MTKLIERKRARKLRLKGGSIKEIAKELRVSPASVSFWCRDIKLTLSQRRKLDSDAFKALQKGRRKANRRQRGRREKEIERLRRKGIEEIGKLTRRELFLSGVALYWAEGFKKDKRLGFANSDPKMIQFFMRWLIEICRVPRGQVRLRVGLNISHKNRIKEVEKYWSEAAGVPLSQFQKPFFQRFKWKKEFKNKDNYFGVLRIRANQQRVLFRKIHGWIAGLKRGSTA
jgi:predicted transcriptional regulator